MEELYSIMRNFLEVEYHQESLLFALDALEAAYSEERQRDARFDCQRHKILSESLAAGIESSNQRT